MRVHGAIYQLSDFTFLVSQVFLQLTQFLQISHERSTEKRFRMKQRFSRWYPKFPDKLLQNRHYVLYGTAMQLPALACALQRAVTERANIHFDYADILSKHVGANVYAMMSRNNCIPMCHEYLGKVTRRSFSPKPEVEWLARETSVQSCYLTAT